MLQFFKKRQEARLVAYSIGQLIGMLSTGLKSSGAASAERLIKQLATNLSEETAANARTIRALVPVTAHQSMLVTLQVTHDGTNVLLFEGCDEYEGFSLSGKLPAEGAIMIDLQAKALQPVRKQARRLYNEFHMMPSAIEAKDFQ